MMTFGAQPGSKELKKNGQCMSFLCVVCTVRTHTHIHTRRIFNFTYTCPHVCSEHISCLEGELYDYYYYNHDSILYFFFCIYYARYRVSVSKNLKKKVCV